MTTTRQHLKLCIQVLFQYVRFYQIAEEICDYQRNGLGYTKMGLTETSLISVLNIAQSMNKLLLQRDKQVVLIGGQTGCPYWGTNCLPLTTTIGVNDHTLSNESDDYVINENYSLVSCAEVSDLAHAGKC